MCFEDGRDSKNAMQPPQDGPQTAKALEVDMVLLLPTKAVPGALRGLIEVIRVDRETWPSPGF
jgi:hypothetical protein